ncbi:PQQ-binding-like beta-propeller repeat protein [Cellulomonas sp. KRMCY2]|uniref:outer membrane protein assembly factor BamB family protein n=1 Tax=Cellulomonas sp. KRMCY2 TaxID=1304865 RepID=UPI00045E9366|nr:PQQ-binding-like beta-propeller repeat protein [Cellulomonas sp. KRMCY2]
MSTDTDRFVGELRQRLSLDDLHSGLNPEVVLTGSRRARRRRTTVSSLVAAASLAAVVLAGPPLLDLGHRMAAAAREARMAQVDGVVHDLGAPLHVAWQADGQLAGVSTPSGTILLEGADGYTALDPKTGDARWTVSVDTARWWCRLSAPDSRVMLGASRVMPGAASGDGPERALCADTAAGTLQVRDIASGDVLTTVTVDWPQWQAHMIDADVIAGGVDDQGRVVARRWDAETGAVVWSYRGHVPMPGADQGVGMVVQLAAVQLVSDSASVRLDIASGAEVSPGTSMDLWSAALAGGVTVIQEGSEPPGTYVVRVVAADGTALLTTPGILRTPQVDDGSVPGLLLVENAPQDSTVRAIDVQTGNELWSRTGTPVAIIDGRLVTWNNSGDLNVLDARTGDVIWRQQVHVPDGGAVTPLTDGENIITIESNSGQTNLVARTLTTGALSWAEPWDPADGTSQYALPTGTALAVGSSRLTGLAP